MLENRPDQKESPTPTSAPAQTSQTKPSQQQVIKRADAHDDTLQHNEPVQTPERENTSHQEDASHQSRFKNLNLDDLSVDELNDIIDAFSKNKSPRRNDMYPFYWTKPVKGVLYEIRLCF